MEISLFEKNNKLIPLAGNPMFSTWWEGSRTSLIINIQNGKVFVTCGGMTIQCSMQKVFDHAREICFSMEGVCMVAGYVENGSILVYDEVIEASAEV